MVKMLQVFLNTDLTTHVQSQPLLSNKDHWKLAKKRQEPLSWPCEEILLCLYSEEEGEVVILMMLL